MNEYSLAKVQLIKLLLTIIVIIIENLPKK